MSGTRYIAEADRAPAAAVAGLITAILDCAEAHALSGPQLLDATARAAAGIMLATIDQACADRCAPELLRVVARRRMLKDFGTLLRDLVLDAALPPLEPAPGLDPGAAPAAAEPAP